MDVIQQRPVVLVHRPDAAGDVDVVGSEGFQVRDGQVGLQQPAAGRISRRRRRRGRRHHHEEPGPVDVRPRLLVDAERPAFRGVEEPEEQVGVVEFVVAGDVLEQILRRLQRPAELDGVVARRGLPAPDEEIDRLAPDETLPVGSEAVDAVLQLDALLEFIRDRVQLLPEIEQRRAGAARARARASARHCYYLVCCLSPAFVGFSGGCLRCLSINLVQQLL